MALTSDYTGIFQDEWLRKQKRSELRDFLRSDVAYAIVEGPPGSLKTACVQHVAAELKYSVKECDVEGVYDDERMRLLGQRLSTNSDLVDLDRGGDGSRVVTLVFNVDLAKNASAWLSLGPARKGTKVIFEVHDIPKELATFVSKGVVRKITFKPLQQRDMQRVASAIGFRNPPPDVLKCGDANMLYTASVTQCSDAWKDLQLKPYSEAEEIVHGRRTEVRGELTPFVLQQQCGQFMSLESYAAFQEDVTLADMMATAANAAEGNCHYALGTCSFLAASARKNADSISGRIDWSGKLQALGKQPIKRSLKLALQDFSLEGFDMLAAKKRRTSERTEYAARGHTTAPAASEAGSDCLARYFGEATLGAAEAIPSGASGAPFQEDDGEQESWPEETLVEKPAPPPEACGEQQRVDHRVQPDPRAEPEFLSVLPEYDFQRGWGLYRTQIRSHEVDGNEGVLQGSFTNTESDLKQQHWILVRYPISTPLELIAEKVQESMSFVLFDVAPTADSVAVLIFKQGQQQIRAKLKLGAIEPQSIQVTHFGKGAGRSAIKEAQRKLCETFAQLPGKHLTNLYVSRKEDVEEYNAKKLFEAVKNMTPDEYLKFVLDAHLKERNGADMTELDRLLCMTQIESRVKEMRKQSGKVVTNVVFASKVKETGQVQRETVFKDSWKKLHVTIHDRSLLTPAMPQTGSKVTLETFLKFPELHQNLTLFLSGLSRKGKTELAKLVCLMQAFKYQKQEEDPRFLMANTLETLRCNQALMLPGVPVLLDDIGGEGCDAQLIYSSISIWKAILQVKDATQCRARNDDLLWAARQPKVLTTNCANLQDWIQTMFPGAKPEHKDAIKLRVAEVAQITESLYSSPSAPTGSQKFLPCVMDDAEASDAIASLFE